MNYRNLIVGINSPVPLKNGKLVTAINFDNAATTPPFVSVLNEIINFSPYYSSIHRGTGYKSRYSSFLYEKSRDVVLDFVHGDKRYNTVIYVKNTTEAINMLSYKMCRNVKKSRVLSTCMEHHSNDLPWRGKYLVDYIDINNDGTLSMEDLNKKLKKYEGTVKLVAVTGASNVTGAKNSIYDIAALCHKYGVKILVDGAQLIPHSNIDIGSPFSENHIDFLAFSAHKMYAPFGTGVLIGPKDIFMCGAPNYKGGGTVKIVTHDYIDWDDPPEKDEAGTPNVIGAVALAASMKVLKNIGMENIEAHEKALTEYALEKLKLIPEVIMYDDIPAENRVGIIPFNLKDIPYDKTAELLSDLGGIAVRCGCFCAQPYVQRLLGIKREDIKKYICDPDLKRPGMVRISFGIYNTFSEIDTFIKILNEIILLEKSHKISTCGKNN